MRIFVDANILFSAAQAGSPTRQLLQAAAGQAHLVTSPHAVDEASRNLLLKRPKLLEQFGEVLRLVEVSGAFRRVKIDLPAKDVPVICGAVGSGCTHLWTGDKRHFGRYFGHVVYGVKVVSSILLYEQLA